MAVGAGVCSRSIATGVAVSKPGAAVDDETTEVAACIVSGGGDVAATLGGSVLTPVAVALAPPIGTGEAVTLLMACAGLEVSRTSKM